MITLAAAVLLLLSPGGHAAVAPAPAQDAPVEDVAALDARARELIGPCEQNLSEGRFSAAAAQVRELDAIARRRPHAWLLVALVQFHFTLGNLAESRWYLHRMIATAEKVENAQLLCSSLNQLSLVLEMEGDRERAVEKASRAIEAAAGAKVDPYTRAGLRINRGRNLLELGYPDRAEVDFVEARRLAEEEELPDLVLSAEDGRARVLLASDSIEEAREVIEGVLQGQAELELVDHRLQSMTALAEVHLAAGRPDEARAVLEEAEQLLEGDELRELGPRGFAQTRSRYSAWAGVAQDLVELEVSKLAEDSRTAAVRRGWSAAGRWKGRILLEELARDSASAQRHGEMLEEALGPDRILVEYAEGRENLYAYVLHAGELSFHDLGEAASVRRLARSFELAVSGLTEPEGMPAKGHELYERLLAPLFRERELPEAGGLVLVPGALLAGVPFEALVTRAPDVEEEVRFVEVPFLIRERPIAYGPSAPVLAVLHERGNRPRAGRYLFVADPLMSSEPDSPTRGSSDLRRLTATRAEVVHIADTLIPPDEEGGRADRDLVLPMSSSKRRSGSCRTELLDLHLGAEANRSLFAGDLSGYGVVHIAAHGRVSPWSPTATGLVLSPDDEGRRLLDLRDIRALDLDADLVVLSACETAVGQLVRGEGVQSMAAGFLESGARGVVASLWLVGDEPTQQLMSYLYEELAEGAAPGVALQRAKVRMLEDPRARGVTPTSRRDRTVVFGAGHPYMWAGFVYSGRIR